MYGNVVSGLISPHFLRYRIVHWDQHGGFLHVGLEDLKLSRSQLHSSDTVSSRGRVRGWLDSLEPLVSLKDRPHGSGDHQDVVSTFKVVS